MAHTQATERKVIGMLRNGVSVRDTALSCGVSAGYVKIRRRMLIDQDVALTGTTKMRTRRKLTGRSWPTKADARQDGGPIAYDDLSDVARDCLDDFERFRARYIGRISTPWQVEAGYKVVQLLESEPEEYLVVNAPPASGKSTLFTHDICAWVTVRNRAVRGILGSYGERVASAYTARLRNTFTRQVPIQAKADEKRLGIGTDAEATLTEDFGGFRPFNQDIWRREQFTVAQHGETMVDDKESTWTAFGKDSASLGWRADLVIWDDLFTVRMRSAEVIADLYEWWDSEAEQRVEPGGLLVLQGQRLRADDIYRYALDKTLWTDELDLDRPDGTPRKYHHIVYKSHYEELCENRHEPTDPPYPGHDAVAADPAAAKGCCQLEPRRVSTPKRQSAMAQGNYETVFQQADGDPSKLLIRPVWIDGGLDPDDGTDHPGCWDLHRALGQLPEWHGEAVRYITADPSPTKFWSVQDWLYVQPAGVEELTGWRYLIDHTRTKMQASELLDWSNDQQSWVGLLDEWVLRARDQGCPVSYVIVENNAAQRWIMQYEHFHRWQAARGISVIPHATTINKTDPALGIEQTLPSAYRYGRVRLPGAGHVARTAAGQLVTEVTKWPEWPTDDCVMAQWFGEFHLGDLIGAVLAQTNRQGFYQDQPTWLGGENVSFAARRIAEMVHG